MNSLAEHFLVPNRVTTLSMNEWMIEWMNEWMNRIYQNTLNQLACCSTLLLKLHCSHSIGVTVGTLLVNKSAIQAITQKVLFENISYRFLRKNMRIGLHFFINRAPGSWDPQPWLVNLKKLSEI